MGLCYWWLRSPGNNSNNAAYVDYDGYGNNNGNNVDNSNNAVRPDLQTIARNLPRAGEVCAHMQRNRIPSRTAGNMQGMGEYMPTAGGTAGSRLSNSWGCPETDSSPAAIDTGHYGNTD